MQRISIEPRSDWQALVEAKGLTFHTSTEGCELWNEAAYYQFTRDQIEQIAVATETLHPLCLKAVEHVVKNDLFPLFNIDARFAPWIAESWKRRERTIYGRFDLAYDGKSPPKLLEYNADTPTTLLEAAVVQWYWMKERFPDLDQFNSIHEQLMAQWKLLVASQGKRPLTFTGMGDVAEDFMTLTYLRDTAEQAGLVTQFLPIEELGYNEDRGAGGRFVDDQEQPISRCFKLYPWEWLFKEEFGGRLLTTPTVWIEPPWKVILSSKAILPILWELFPDCPYLLPATFDPMEGACVRKPIYSREGANLALMSGSTVELESDGPYEGPYVYQKRVELPEFEGQHPVIGSWIAGDVACGMGIREDTSPITNNLSPFVPHVFLPP